MAAPLEVWSREYVLAPTAEVYTHTSENAVMDAELYEDFVDKLGEPIIGHVGGLHYHFQPTNSIPAGKAAVPKCNHRGERGSMALLLAR